ncbi:MAG: putative Ig domain-containing protein [Planctomycetes bacterium]|nr:putative Ig domain-containing protein [Planctomycetota bacterium]
MNKQLSIGGIGLVVIMAALMTLAVSPSAEASIAYGSLNNFDCVNDTGVEAHGFEIELDDVHSTDITYTYDYNHYGIPKITEDNTDPLHPRVFIRYAATRNSDGTWTAFTAIPSGPITPTDGHQFTNPSVNFGGEHFGAGYYGAPTAVKYNWLIDDGTGHLVHGPPVYVATPTFTYYPPAPAQPPQVQAVIVPPPPPAPPVLQFGEATWVKDIKTTTHNPNKVGLRDLVDPDPDNPGAQNWANGEPAEVETEWRILQTEFANANNPKGKLAGVPQDLPGGDEIITRRYEFYKYTGPLDAESGEGMADQVAADGIHGVGSVTFNDHFDPGTGEWVTVTVDLSTVEVVGEFFGAQMAGFDVAPALGLIDHIPDGELGVAYADRMVVVPGADTPFHATTSGTLPDGTLLGEFTGVFTGTPTVAGVFTFTVDAKDLFTDAVLVSKEYTVTISAVVAPPECFTDADCVDADACTTDLCVAGVCQHQPIAACCNTDAECNDADGCTRDLCVNHICTHDPVPGCCNTDAECVDANDCTLDACVGHLCEHAPLAGCCLTDADCADANVCTADTCVNHVCEHGPIAGCCLTDAECADADACTLDACANHVCTHDSVPGCCNTDAECADGNVCTRDACQANACVHDAIVNCCTTDAQCVDTDPCTRDFCDAATNLCVHQLPAGCCTDADCADTNVCTHDACVNQICEHTPIAACCTADSDCDDGNGCTADRCVNNTCQHEPSSNCCTNDAQCDDGIACTVDKCSNLGACAHTLNDAACDDGVDCTNDRCVPSVGCVHEPDDARCDDGLFCNGQERCHPVSGCHHGIRPCPPPFCDEARSRCNKPIPHPHGDNDRD